MVFVISLDSLNTLSIIKTFNLPSKPSSVGTFGSKKKIILYISFANGTILKIEVLNHKYRVKKIKLKKNFLEYVLLALVKMKSHTLGIIWDYIY